MKKVSLLAITALTVLALAGCSNNTDESANSSTAESSSVAESTAKEEKDKFADQAETGEGALDLAHISGNTADGDEITVYYDKDTFPTSVAVETKGIDDSKLSYIYVDGQLVIDSQLGDSVREIQLQDTPVAIKEGIHNLQLVQYVDDKEGGEIVTFKQQPYTLKIK